MTTTLLYPTPTTTPSLSVAEDLPPPPARSRRARSPKREQILAVVTSAGAAGVTWRGVSAVTGRDHGAVSGALSTLQNDGLIVRLKARRGGDSVYVLADLARPQDVAPRRIAKVSAQALAEAREAGRSAGFDEGWQSGYDDGVAAGRNSVPALTDDKVRALRREGAEKFRAEVLQATEAMLRATDPLNAAATHSKSCWRTHPACTIRALRAVITSAAA